MSTIIDALKGILPSFGRKDVREKIRVIASKLLEIVAPSLTLYKESFNDASLHSAYGRDFMQALLRFLPSSFGNRNAPFVRVMEVTQANLTRLLDQLSEFVGSHMPDAIHIEGITYQKGTVLRLIELADFYVDYTSRHLAALVAAETNIEAFGKADSFPYTKAEQKYLLDHRNDYFKVLELFFEDPKTIMAKIQHIPEVLMSETDPASVPALAGAAADPLRLGIIPVISDIFHWVGIRKVDWEIERYERAKKEKRAIELRLEALRQKRGGAVDARNEAIIDGYERELVLVREKIARMSVAA